MEWFSFVEPAECLCASEALLRISSLFSFSGKGLQRSDLVNVRACQRTCEVSQCHACSLTANALALPKWASAPLAVCFFQPLRCPSSDLGSCNTKPDWQRHLQDMGLGCLALRFALRSSPWSMQQITACPKQINPKTITKSKTICVSCLVFFAP